MPVVLCEYRAASVDPLLAVPHSHARLYELIHVVSGKGHVLLGDNYITLAPDSLYLINGGYPHCMRPEAAEGYLRSKILMTPDFFTRLSGLAQLGALARALAEQAGLAVRLPRGESERVDALFQSAFTAFYAQDIAHMARANARLMELCAVFYTYLEGGHAVVEPPSPRTQLLEAVNALALTPFSLDDIAQRAHLDRVYCCRLFKRMTGVSIMVYAREKRMAHAKMLLAGGDAPVSDIARRCGYNDFSHFSHVFRLREGMPPLAYRALRRKDAPSAQ